jgi:hypothetical protein
LFIKYRSTLDISWCRNNPTSKVFVYLGEKEEYYDNHAAIRNSFDTSEINSLSFLSSKNYDCGPIRTLGDIADFFNIDIKDYPETPIYKTSNGVSLSFKSLNREEKAYPCGFRAMTIRSSKIYKIF